MSAARFRWTGCARRSGFRPNSEDSARTCWDGEEIDRRDRKTPTLAPGKKITRFLPNTFQESGTIGLLVRIGTDRFILTNHHVLDDDSQVSEFSMDVYSLERKTSAGIRCNNPAARIIADRGVETRVPFEGKRFFVDATLATLYAGVNGSNVVEGVGALDQGLRDLAIVPTTGSQPTEVITVQKRGAVTDLAQGTVVQTVSATKEVSGSETILHLSGRVFGRPGDSDSCVVDTARHIVGLHHSSSATRVDVMRSGRSEPELLPFGNGFASFIRPVFSAMGLNEATGVIPPGSPSSGALMAVPDATGPEWHDADQGVEQIEAVLRQTGARQRLLALAYRHAERVAHLVHHRRRVTVAWYRSRGPAHAVALLNALREPDGRLPAAIDGVTLVEALSRMRSVLMQEGNVELREAIRENADFILDLAARADSVPHLLEAFGAREAACMRS